MVCEIIVADAAWFASARLGRRHVLVRPDPFSCGVACGIWLELVALAEHDRRELDLLRLSWFEPDLTGHHLGAVEQLAVCGIGVEPRLVESAHPAKGTTSSMPKRIEYRDMVLSQHGSGHCFRGSLPWWSR